jgi:hypothetical protein
MKAKQLTNKEKSVLKSVAENVFENVEWCEINECYRENYNNFYQYLDRDEYKTLKSAISKL